jgi:hypothetical protein
MERRYFLKLCAVAAADFLLATSDLLMPRQAAAENSYSYRYENGGLVYTFDITNSLLVTCIESEHGSDLDGFRYRIREDYVKPKIARPLLAVTGGFSSENGRESVGAIVRDGELITAGCSPHEYTSVVFQRKLWRRDFYFGGINASYGNNFCMRRGGYARLLPFSKDIWERDIRPPDVANRIAIGTRPVNGRKKIIVHAGPMDVLDAAKFMEGYGCTEAVLGDGGSKYARFSWIDDSEPQHPESPIKDVIVIMERL